MKIYKLGRSSSLLAWKIPWTEDLVGYSPWGCKELDTTERLYFTLLSQGNIATKSNDFKSSF